jgi:hypothetical protein
MEEPVFRTISVNAHPDGAVVPAVKLFARILASMGSAFYPINVSAILVGLEPRAMLPSVNQHVPPVIILLTVPVAVPVSLEACATFVFSVQTLSEEDMP